MGVAWCLTKRASIITLCMYVLWFNFNLGSNFIFFCFWVLYCMIMSLKQRKIKFEPRIKLSYNIYIVSKHHKLFSCCIKRFHSLDCLCVSKTKTMMQVKPDCWGHQKDY